MAAFAEVFWADLSAAGEGTLRLLLRLFTVIFDLRYIPYVAAASPDLYVARWLRLTVYVISWLLCGPVAGLTAFIAYMLAARYTSSKALSLVNVSVAPELNDRAVFAVALVGVVLGLILLALRRRKKWRGHWAFVIEWIVLAAIGDALFSLTLTSLAPAALVARPFSMQLWAFLSALYTVFFLVGVLTMMAFLAWLLARGEAHIKSKRRFGPALDAALAATLLQVGLWVIVVPTVAPKSESPVIDSNWFWMAKRSARMQRETKPKACRALTWC